MLRLNQGASAQRRCNK